MYKKVSIILIAILITILFLLVNQLNNTSEVTESIKEEIEKITIENNKLNQALTQSNDKSETNDDRINQLNKKVDESSIQLDAMVSELSTIKEELEAKNLEYEELLEDISKYNRFEASESAMEEIQQNELEMTLNLYEAVFYPSKIKDVVFKSLNSDANQYSEGVIDDEGGLAFDYLDRAQGQDYITYVLNIHTGVIYDYISHSYIENIFGINVIIEEEMIKAKVRNELNIDDDERVSLNGYDRGNMFISIVDINWEKQFGIELNLLTGILYNNNTNKPIGKIDIN